MTTRERPAAIASDGLLRPKHEMICQGGLIGRKVFSADFPFSLQVNWSFGLLRVDFTGFRGKELEGFQLTT